VKGAKSFTNSQANPADHTKSSSGGILSGMIRFQSLLFPDEEEHVKKTQEGFKNEDEYKEYFAAIQEYFQWTLRNNPKYHLTG
jgi:hypothetical protein